MTIDTLAERARDIARQIGELTAAVALVQGVPSRGVRMFQEDAKRAAEDLIEAVRTLRDEISDEQDRADRAAANERERLRKLEHRS